jgi:RNA polymerase sigma-70 factor (ECF subfamily)
MSDTVEAATVVAYPDLAPCVQRARSGDRFAMSELIGMFREDIYRMVYYRTGNRMDAEDLTQEIFLKVFDNLKALKDTGMFRPWLYRIAVNRVNDYHRRKKFLSFFVPASEREDGPEMEDVEQANDNVLDQVIKKEFWHQVSAFMHKLSKLEREVFQLRFMDHLGIAEISAVLDRGESTVKTHLYRAVKKFQAEEHLIELIRGVES